MTTTYTQQEFNQVKLDIVDYLTLVNPIFEGQTKCDNEGNYKIYFSDNGILYGFKKNLYS